MDEAGQLFSCGIGYEGSLGHGDRSDVYEPKLISTLKDEKIIQASCGRGKIMRIHKRFEIVAQNLH